MLSCFLGYTKIQVEMKKTMNYYLRTTAGRIKLIKFLGQFAVIGGILVAAVMLLATYLSAKAL